MSEKERERTKKKERERKQKTKQLHVCVPLLWTKCTVSGGCTSLMLKERRRPNQGQKRVTQATMGQVQCVTSILALSLGLSGDGNGPLAYAFLPLLSRPSSLATIYLPFTLCVSAYLQVNVLQVN